MVHLWREFDCHRSVGVCHSSSAQVLSHAHLHPPRDAFVRSSLCCPIFSFTPEEGAKCLHPCLFSHSYLLHLLSGVCRVVRYFKHSNFASFVRQVKNFKCRCLTLLCKSTIADSKESMAAEPLRLPQDITGVRLMRIPTPHVQTRQRASL
jgi:hypothetical protein